MEDKINKPYPKISVTAPNETYGLMILDNIGSMDSEMSAVAQYLYDHSITQTNFLALKKTFFNIAMAEMHHLDIFMELALKLGMDPRWWSCQDDQRYYWSPSYLNYPNRLDTVLTTAIENECHAIEKYQQQISMINDPYIVAILQRIIEDEQLHVKILKEWETKLVR